MFTSISVTKSNSSSNLSASPATISFDQSHGSTRSAGTRPQAPSRQEIIPLLDSGIVAAEGLEVLCADPYELSRRYEEEGLKSILHSRNVLLASTTACIGGFLFGVDQGLISVTLVMDQFLEVFPSVNTSLYASAGFYKGLLTAMLELGAVLGAMQSGFLADRYSRRYTLLAGVVWFILGSILQTTAFSLAQLIVGRTLGGVGIGVLSSTAPMYISEIAPPNLRGRLLVLEEFMIVFGIVIAYYLTYGTRLIASEWAFRLPMLIQIFPAIILAGLIYYLPFSPRWLAAQGRDAESLANLSILRQLPTTDVRVQAEWILIRAEAARCQESSRERHPELQGSDFNSQFKLEVASWLDCFSPSVIRRTHIGIGLMLFQQLVGINSLIYYAPTLFGTLGFDLELQLTMSGVTNICQLIAVVLSFVLIDKIGRRPLLLFGSAAMTCSLVIVGVLIAVFGDDWKQHQAGAWVGVACIFAYMLSFGVGWAPVPWTMPAEVHSLSFRAKGVALATISNWSGNFVVGLITPAMIQGIGYGTFLFFGSFAFLSGIWAYFIIPETRGRTLEQIDGLFKSTSASDDERMKDEIVCILLSSKRGSLRIDESLKKS